MTYQKSNVILLHGCWPARINGVLVTEIPLLNSNNEGNWMGWTKKRLEERGYQVTCPMIINPIDKPYEAWKNELDKEAITEDSILVGYSCGGYALLRYLAESGKKIKKLIMIAPGSKYAITDPVCLSDMSADSINTFYEREITHSLQAQIAEGTTIFVSNDREVILKSVELFTEIMDAKVIQLEERGHFSFLIKEFPELVEEIVQ